MAESGKTSTPRTMRPLSNGVIPLVHRGAEALEALLNGDEAKAEQQLRVLLRSELAHLGSAADQLAELARRVIAETWQMPKGGDHV